MVKKQPLRMKQTKPRSPKYPSIGLDRAVAFAKEIYAHENKNAAPTTVVLGHMGYAARSGAGFTAMAALRSFGLIEGRHGECRLSDRGLDVAIAEPGSEKYVNALRQAALSPDIHRDIWEKYDRSLPSDSTLRYYLERDRGFTLRAIKQFIPQFRSTLEFAGIGPGEDVSDPKELHSTPIESRNEQERALPKVVSELAKTTSPSEQDRATFPLDEGVAVLAWPREISSESFEDLVGWIEVALRKIARSAGTEYPRPKE